MRKSYKLYDACGFKEAVNIIKSSVDTRPGVYVMPIKGSHHALFWGGLFRLSTEVSSTKVEQRESALPRTLLEQPFAD